MLAHEKYLRWLERVYYSGEMDSPRQSHDDHVVIFEKFRRRDLTGLITSIQTHVDRQRERVLQILTGERTGNGAQRGETASLRPRARAPSAAHAVRSRRHRTSRPLTRN